MGELKARWHREGEGDGLDGRFPDAGGKTAPHARLALAHQEEHAATKGAPHEVHDNVGQLFAVLGQGQAVDGILQARLGAWCGQASLRLRGRRR